MNTKLLHQLCLRNTKIAFSLAIGMLLIASLLPAQSTRYWSNNFGEEAALLSGAVVGKVAGPSAIFYNPAFIAKITDSRFTLNADIIQLDMYTWENALGGGESVKSIRPGLVPGFTAVLLKPKKKDRLTYEVAILTRDQYEFDISVNRKWIRDVFPDLAGNEIYTGTFENKSKYTNIWAGFGGGYEINDHFSIGLSTFVTVKSLSENFLIDVNAFPQNEIIIDNDTIPFFASNYSSRSYKRGTDWRWLTKIGLMWNNSNWGLGLNFTLPSVKIAGTGEVSKKLSYSNIPNMEGTELEDYILIDSQKRVPLQWKDPLSIALGVHYALPNQRSEFNATFEYFFPLDLYKSFSAEVNPDITSKADFEQLPNKDFLSEYQGATKVLNMALGYKQVLSPAVNLLLGFRTDYNASHDIDYSQIHEFNKPINGVTMNVYHFSAGTQLNLGRGHIVAGLQWSGGSDFRKPQLTNLAPTAEQSPDDPPLIGPVRNEMNIFYRSLSVIFGLDFNISKD